MAVVVGEGVVAVVDEEGDGEVEEAVVAVVEEEGDGEVEEEEAVGACARRWAPQWRSR